MHRILPGFLLSAFTLQAGLFPTANLGPDAVQYFEQYVSRYEDGANQLFTKAGEMWIDKQGASRRKEVEAGKSLTQTLAGENIPGGHIHHLFGTARIPGATLATFASTMQNYSRYPEYFKPDVAKGTSKPQADSSPGAQHFQVSLKMVHSTAWMDVAFDTAYDTRYVYLDDKRLASTSRSTYIREYRDAHDLAQGTYPEGSDHGFLWKTYTSWHARERDGGLDLEFNSISLCRQIPLGAGWWANKTARTTAEKMIQNAAAAIRNNINAREASGSRDFYRDGKPGLQEHLAN